MSVDRNLLFGILAVQLDFVSQGELMAGMNAWLLDKTKPLGDILRDLGHLPLGRLQLLDALVVEHLKKHGDDPQRSLAALSSVDEDLFQSLASLADTDVQKTLVQLSAPPAASSIPASSGTIGYDSESGDGGDAAGAVTRPSGLRYRILRPHARGGLGEVFVAEDTELGRQVALKEIQGRHADNAASRSRFVLEAEITGGLEHPGIVPVYGLGTYADGRPFYAMRFVQGDNLLEAIRRFHGPSASPERQRRDDEPVAGAPGWLGFASLEFRNLLQRFIDVCNAVAYAHSRGVLHRDLKPGNVMLGPFGETLVVDWGLAKTTGQSGGEASGATLYPRSGGNSPATVAGQALGTPAYMSPEQADGRLDDLGPAADVYSLGATLYEVLTGRAPFTATTVTDLLDAVKAGRFPPPRAVSPAVPPALEAVCQKAMALVPADRYAVATDLAREVERWLADEPVAAYPEPLAARTRRWVRRHARLATGVGAALAVGLVALGVVAWQRERARRAVAAESAEKEIALATATKRLTQVERANDILSSVFADLDPKKVENDGVPLQAALGERLDRATAEIEGDAIGDSLAVARMQMKLGQSQLGLGYPEKAIRLFERAGVTFASQLGPDHVHTLASKSNVAAGQAAAGRIDRALALQNEVLTRLRTTLGPEHPKTLSGMNDLAERYRAAGQIDRALPLYEEAHRLRQATLGRDHPDTVVGMNDLALGYHTAGQLGRALPLYEEALRLQTTQLGPDHPNTLSTMTNLAACHQAAGQIGRALPLYEEALRLRKSRLGPSHPETLNSQSNLAAGYYATRQLDRAIPLFEDAIVQKKARLGPDHPATLASMNNLAVAYQAAGQLDRALALTEEVLRIRKAKLGPDHPETATSLNNLAAIHHAAGQFDRAAPLFEEALELRKAKLGPDHPDTLMTMNNLAEVYRAAGQLDRAVPLHEETLRLRKAKLGPDHPSTLMSMNNLALGYRAAGQLDRAIRLYEEAAPGIKSRLGPDHPSAIKVANNLALGYGVAGRFAEAEPIFRELADSALRTSGDTSSSYAAALVNLGFNRLEQQEYANAEATLRTALSIREKAQPDAWTTFDTHSLVGASLLGQRKFAEAESPLLAGFNGLKQHADKLPKHARPRLLEAAERLVRLYDALGKPDEAAKYRKELDALKAAK